MNRYSEPKLDKAVERMRLKIMQGVPEFLELQDFYNALPSRKAAYEQEKRRAEEQRAFATHIRGLIGAIDGQESGLSGLFAQERERRLVSPRSDNDSSPPVSWPELSSPFRARVDIPLGPIKRLLLERSLDACEVGRNLERYKATRLRWAGLGSIDEHAEALNEAICRLKLRAGQHPVIPDVWGVLSPEGSTMESIGIIKVEMMRAARALKVRGIRYFLYTPQGRYREVESDVDGLARFEPSYWEEVCRRIDTLPRYLPAVDRFVFDMPDVPKEPGEFALTSLWPTLRFDEEWEVLRAAFAPVDEDPYGRRIFLGRDFSGVTPQFVAREALHTHVYVHGSTGTGKTSSILIPLIAQVIRGSDEAAKKNPHRGRPSPLLVIDLKGDLALYHSTRLEAQRRGQRFRFLTPEYGKRSPCKTDLFDPFRSLRHLRERPGAMAAVFSRAMEIENGRGYGADHFASRYTKALAQAFSTQPRTFKELAAAIGPDRELRGLRDKLELLTYDPVSYVMRNCDGIPDELVVDMPSVIENREVVYIYIPQDEGGRPALALAQLALWCFQNAARNFNRGTRWKRRCYAVVDEFQEIAGMNTLALFKQGRSHGVSYIFANQSPRDLDTVRLNLSENMLSEPGMQVCLGVRSKQILDLFQDMSGEEIVRVPETSWSRTVTNSTMQSSGESSGFSDNTYWSDSRSSHSGLANGYDERMGFFGFWGWGLSSYGTSKLTSTGEALGRSEGGGYASTRGRLETEGIGKAVSNAISERMTAHFRPCLEANSILDASNAPLGSVVWIPHAGPHNGRPYLVQHFHSMPKELYELLSRTPWPVLTDSERAELAPHLGGEPAYERPEWYDFDKRLAEFRFDDELIGAAEGGCTP